jgi:hypothetical protein
VLLLSAEFMLIAYYRLHNQHKQGRSNKAIFYFPTSLSE